MLSLIKTLLVVIDFFSDFVELLLSLNTFLIFQGYSYSEKLKVGLLLFYTTLIDEAVSFIYAVVNNCFTTEYC